VKNSVVVVDDVPESQESSTALLTAEGYEVESVANGEGALQMLSKRRPTAVLFQVLDPANGAIDFVRRLALSRHASSVPVVVVTALNEYQVGSFLDGVPGVRRVLHSPCTPEALRQAMADAVRYTKAN
jgi:CheY-like chemotaxis protein